jgi:gamma-glutamylcyclotransferase
MADSASGAFVRQIPPLPVTLAVGRCYLRRRKDRIMALVFQYGSNALSVRLNSNNRLRGDALPIGLVVTVESFRLDFTTWSEGNQCAAADIVPDSDRKIWGVLYKIPDYLIERETSGDRKSLDTIEGNNYQRVPIKVEKTDGMPVEGDVMTYVVKNRRFDIRTSYKYAEYIVSGLREHNAPDEYIDYVKMRVITNNPDLKQEIEEL